VYAVWCMLFMNKLWTSHEQLLFWVYTVCCSWTSHEQVMNKL